MNNEKDDKNTYQENEIENEDRIEKASKGIREDEIEESIEEEMNRGLDETGEIERETYKEEPGNADLSSDIFQKHAKEIGHSKDPNRGTYDESRNETDSKE